MSIKLILEFGVVLGALLMGALCGGQTVALDLSAANDATDSLIPVLGFTVTYAISDVLLAVWGPVIVAFT